MGRVGVPRQAEDLHFSAGVCGGGGFSLEGGGREAPDAEAVAALDLVFFGGGGGWGVRGRGCVGACAPIQTKENIIDGRSHLCSVYN